MQAALHPYKNLYHFHNHSPLTTPATLEDMDFKIGPSRLVRVQRFDREYIVKFGTWSFRLGITRYTTLPLSKGSQDQAYVFVLVHAPNYTLFEAHTTSAYRIKHSGNKQ